MGPFWPVSKENNKKKKGPNYLRQVLKRKGKNVKDLFRHILVFVDHIRPKIRSEIGLPFIGGGISKRRQGGRRHDHVRAKSLKVHLRRTWQNVGETLFHV